MIYQRYVAVAPAPAPDKLSAAAMLEPGSFRRIILNVALYFGSLAYLQVPVYKTVGIVAIVSALAVLRHGARLVDRIGLLLVGYAIGVWIGVFPTIVQWRNLMHRFID